MKIKNIVSGVLALILLITFLTEPKVLLSGAAKGLLLCSEIIIPSLFPFTAVCMFLFTCGFTKSIGRLIDPISKRLSGLSGSSLLIFIMSFIGGFPVGAKLIERAYANKEISESTARRMIQYSVNPGPAFVIIGVGQTLLNNTLVGTILFVSGILSSLTLFVVLSFKERKEKQKKLIETNENNKLTDSFVYAVFEASESIIRICGFVVLFSSIITIVSSKFSAETSKYFLALLEISNGVALFPNNIVVLAFIIGFSGICIHFQIISICKSFKIGYLRFFISKLICGALSSIYSIMLVRVFRVYYPVISLNKELLGGLSVVSFPLSAALIFMSVTLLISIKQNFVEKRR